MAHPEACFVPVSCVGRPSAALRRRLGEMYPERGMPASGQVPGILDDIVAVDALASVLTEAIRACTTSDGRLDPVDLGHHVLRRMIDDGGASQPKIPNLFGTSEELRARAGDVVVAEALGRLISEAAEKTQGGDGLVETRKVATYVLRAIIAMKEGRR